MHQVLNNILTNLSELASDITNSYTDDKTMTEIWGWQFPPLNRHDLAALACNLYEKIERINIEEIDEETISILEEIPERIKLFKANTLKRLFDGNGNTATPLYISLIVWISSTLETILGWEILQDTKAMPIHLSKRLRSIHADLNEIIPNKEDLKSQIRLIQEARDTAESLPVDLQKLEEARQKISKSALEAAEMFGKMEAYNMQAFAMQHNLKGRSDEADRLVAQCEEAYKITTTKGLAGAFDQRAKRLSQSMWVWVIGLLGALGIGIYIGAHRFEILNSILIEPTADWGRIWIQIFLSLLSLGAPIWFAWLATKQISQRFRLAEDYAFKASVAKAYEGYRKEAARIDEDFELRLFGSALTRLEEAPLRLVETDSHGSPWHELVNSKQFQKAMDTVPDLKDKFIDVVKKGVQNLDFRTVRKNEKSEQETKPED